MSAALNLHVGSLTAGRVCEMALGHAKAWRENEAGVRDTLQLNDWRDSCRDELRDLLSQSERVLSKRDQLLKLWGTTFDSAVGTDNRRSILEERFAILSDEVIRKGKEIGTPSYLLEELNKAYTLCSGMGAVMRIVVAQPVVEDQYNQYDPSSEPPLSKCAIAQLQSMVALLAESIADDIDRAACKFSTQVS